MTKEQNERAKLEAIYGPLAAHSEYKRGERVRYRDAIGMIHEGEIVWVCPSGQTVEGMPRLPLQYIIATPGFPSIVNQTEILV